MNNQPLILNALFYLLICLSIQSMAQEYREGFKGDVIKSYNNHLIQNSDDAKNLYEELKTANKLDLTILRNNKIKTLHFDIQSASQNNQFK
jgi:hypothetical protein